MLMAYDWPGNVRELENICERAAVVARGPLILAEDLPPSLHPEWQSAAGPDRAHATLAEILEDVERSVILRTLREHGYNRSKTAQALGINRRTLYAKLKQYGLDGSLPVEG